MTQFKRKRTPSSTTSTFDLSTHVASVNYYKLVTSGNFVEGRLYYTKDGDDYTVVDSAEYVIGNPIPANTYYIVDSHDPHPQYLLRRDYGGTNGGEYSNPDVIQHNDNVNAHSGVLVSLSEYNTFKNTTNGQFSAANTHIAPAVTENQSKHKDKDGFELYSFRNHKHDLHEIGLNGAASATHNHDATYAVKAHNHDDRYSTTSHQHYGYLSSTALDDTGIYPSAIYNPGNDNPDYQTVDTFSNIEITYPVGEVSDNMYVLVADEATWYKATLIETPNPDDIDNPIITVEWNVETEAPSIPMYLDLDIDTITTQSFVVGKDLINVPFSGYTLIRTYLSQISEDVTDDDVVVLYGVDNLYQIITNNKQQYHRTGSSYTVKTVTGDETSYANSKGSGDRSTTVEVTYDGAAVDFGDNGNDSIINGNRGPALEDEVFPAFRVQYPTEDESFMFNFWESRYVNEIKCYIEATTSTSMGMWVVVGSKDGETWSDPLCLPTELKGAGTTFPLSNPTVFSLTSNSTYQYYKLQGVSGSTMVGTLWEIEFKIDAGADVFSTQYIKKYSWEAWISDTSNIVSKSAIKAITNGQTIFNIIPECGMANTEFIEVTDNGNVLHDAEIVRSETEFTVTLSEALPNDVLEIGYVYHTPVATASSVETHTANTTRHITGEERTTWNADGPAISALALVVDGLETEITGMSNVIVDINNLLGL